MRIIDWSSDVCSSDLRVVVRRDIRAVAHAWRQVVLVTVAIDLGQRVGECALAPAEAQRVLPLQRQVQVRLVLAHQVVAIRLGAEVLLPVCIEVAAIEVDAVVTTPQLADEIGIQLDATRQAAARIDESLVDLRSEEHTSALQSLMRSSYAVLWLKKKH